MSNSKNSIVLGDWIGGGHATIDLDNLMLTRALIQASSGSGKSVALRRMLEVTHGHVQQIIVDPEGEFASLRERGDYIIAAAQDGDVVASPKTANLLAVRLLETQASAVLDISELRPRDRHAFVRLLFEGLLAAPKSLRHPVLVALDEAHMFAPEKGQGESEALDAVIDLASLGRKRGLALLAATQRIGKYHKSAAADLKNRLIGNTALDVDVKRAAFDLGLSPKEALAILRPLNPGHFYAFGPAFGQNAPRELLVALPETSHPKIGHKRRLAPPKPSDAIKAILPKLAGLPKEAEEEAHTVDELKRALATVRRELTQAQRQQPKATASSPKLDAAAARRDAATIKRLSGAIEALMKYIVNINATGFSETAGVDPEAMTKAIETAVGQVMKLADAKLAERTKVLQRLQSEGGRLIASVQKLLADQAVEISVDVKHTELFTVAPTPAVVRSRPVGASTSESGEKLSKAERKALTALAQYPDGRTKAQVAILSAYAINGGGFNNALSALRSRGFIEGTNDRLAITDAGVEALGPYDPLPSGDALLQHWLGQLSKAERAALEALVRCGPLTKEALAREANYEPNGGGFNNALSRLRTLELISGRGELKASESLF